MLGNLGQLKVVSLSKIDDIRMKFQNLIPKGCCFGPSFICDLTLKPSLFIKLKHHLGAPEKSSMFFFLCKSFTFFLYHLGQNRDPRLTLLQNPGLHLLLHLRPLRRFLSHCLLLSWHLKELFFLLLPQSDETMWEEVQSVSWKLCCYVF